MTTEPLGCYTIGKRSTLEELERWVIYMMHTGYRPVGGPFPYPFVNGRGPMLESNGEPVYVEFCQAMVKDL